MFTRSRARKQRNEMDSVSTEEEFPINNQLGMPGIFEEETELPTPEENIREGEQGDQITEAPQCQTVDAQHTHIESHNQVNEPQLTSSNISMLMQAIQTMKNQMKEALQENNAANNTQMQTFQTRIQESIQTNNAKLQEVINKNEETRQTVVQIKQEIDRQINNLTQDTN